MVFWRGHRVGPHVVTVLQMLADLLARHTEHEEQVLKTVEFEHVGHRHVASLNGGVER